MYPLSFYLKKKVAKKSRVESNRSAGFNRLYAVSWEAINDMALLVTGTPLRYVVTNAPS